MSEFDTPSKPSRLKAAIVRLGGAVNWLSLAATIAGFWIASHAVAVLLLRADGFEGDAPALVIIAVSCILGLGAVGAALLIRRAISSPGSR